MALDEDVSLTELAARSEGLTGAEIASVCQRAAMRRVHEFLTGRRAYDDSLAERFAVTRADFETAIEEMAGRSGGRRPEPFGRID